MPIAGVIAAAEERLRCAEGNRPPEGWGHLDGVELVVRGTKGRRVQVARARAGQWTARSEDRFLEVFAATCNVKAAYEAAGKSKGSAYMHRRRWPAFARRWDEAEGMATVRLEWALVERDGNPFSSTALPEPAPLPPMSVDEIIQNLSMHQYRTCGRAGRRGRRRPPPEPRGDLRGDRPDDRGGRAGERAERGGQGSAARRVGEAARVTRPAAREIFRPGGRCLRASPH